jgi:L-lactate permease
VRVAAGFIVAVAYAATFALHGQLLPGVVGGVLCGLLVFLLLREAEARRRRRSGR